MIAIWACLSRVALPADSLKIICTRSTFDFCSNSMTIHQPRRSAECKEYYIITYTALQQKYNMNKTECAHFSKPRQIYAIKQLLLSIFICLGGNCQGSTGSL